MELCTLTVDPTNPHVLNMAKTRTGKSSRSFSFETISKTEASDRRSRRGTRRSKYSIVGEQFEALKQDKVLVFQASKNEVQGVRNYMRRNFDGQYKVNSRRTDDEHFEVHISKV